jgi:organic hydroperoxide reductase OsmC/OhrA
VEITVALRNLPGTEAAVGWAGAHTLVVDRSTGVAGGMGLGFNGGELLALAIGGCLCNDLRYAAHATGLALGEIAVDVALEIAGDPPMTRSVELAVSCAAADGSPTGALVEKAFAGSIVANSVRAGFPVSLRSARAG